MNSNPSKLNNIAYIPVEIKDREFDAKLSLAFSLQKNGMNVMIGQIWGIYENIINLPRGIFLFKSLNRIHDKAINAAKDHGHIILAQEEEVMGLCSEASLSRVFSHNIYDNINKLIVTGDFEKNYHIKNGMRPADIILAGNPRIDLLMPRYRRIYKAKMAEIKERFGNYILINTNIKFTNNIYGDLEKASSIDNRALSKSYEFAEKTRKDLIALERESLSITNKIIALILERLAGYQIIIRPHPAENRSHAKHLYPNHDRISVIYEESHIPWTLGASVLIHSSCTTGLEAAILGVPAISLIPGDSWITDSIISNLVNIRSTSAEDAIDRIEEALSARHGKSQSEQLSSVDKYIHSLRNAGAIEIITNLISSFEIEPCKSIEFKFLSSKNRSESELLKCKISSKEVHQKLSALSDDDNFAQPSYVKVADSCFLLPAI